jgi:polygalacturonase
VIKTTSKQPSQNIEATNCSLSTRTNAIKLGTESIGDFENITFSNCRITNTGMAGIALYTVDGGNMHNVNISDITMDGVAAPICIRLGARLKTFRDGDQPMTCPGKLSDVTISNVIAKNVGLIGILVNGVPGYPIVALKLSNIQIEVPGGGTADEATVQLPEKEASYPEFSMFGKTMPAYGIYARHVHGLTVDHVQTTALVPDARPATLFVDVDPVPAAL